MRFKQILLAGLCGLLAPFVVTTQAQEAPRARELFVTQHADGLEVTVKKLDKNGRFNVVDPGREFKMGDQLRVEFRSNFDGLVYFLNITPKGEMRVIHRDSVRADSLNVLPSSPNTIQFDNDSGVESLKIILSRQPIDEFETALNNNGGMLGGTASGVVNELAQKPNSQNNHQNASQKVQNTNNLKNAPVSEEVGVVTPKAGQECGGLELSMGGNKLNCRGMIVAKGDDRKGEGSVFVAASNKSKNGSLQAGDVAVMELRFKHVN